MNDISPACPAGLMEHFLAQQGMHDPEWDALVQSFRERNPADRLQTARDLAEIAGVYRRHEHHWSEFQQAKGIAALDRGRTAGSKFHPICRHLCRLGLCGDETGRASVLAAVLDIWETTDIAPADIPKWITGTKGGIRAIYKSAGAAHGDPLYWRIDNESTTAEWYKYIFDALGCRFVLDPASPGREGVPWIPVDEVYTSGGLERNWHDFVWLNAPYGRDTLPAWIRKFIDHGNGIALVFDRTSTQWWQELAAQADAILFLNKKIAFVPATGEKAGASAIGSILVAIGEKGVEALKRASQRGLGILTRPERGDKPDRRNNRRNRTMNDIVFTGDVIPRALIQHVRQYVKPGGKWLDHCRGPGAFYDAMPEPRAYCEITEGRDFFDWTEPVACAATNPPWSHDEPNTYTRIARHAFEIADVVLLLTKISTALGTYSRHKHWREAGHGLREIILIRWQDADFTNADGTDKSHEGIALAAFIWVRGYEGDSHWNYDWFDNGIPEVEGPIARPSGEPAEIAAAAD
jgi:hypothetical protein